MMSSQIKCLPVFVLGGCRGWLISLLPLWHLEFHERQGCVGFVGMLCGSDEGSYSYLTLPKLLSVAETEIRALRSMTSEVLADSKIRPR